VKEDVEPDMGIIASPDGPVVAGGGTTGPLTTGPLRNGDLPRLARPEGCYAARRSGKAGEPVSAPTGRIGRPH
jgi:hypothetical protein